MANSVDPDETAHYELFLLDLHCLQRYQLRSRNEKFNSEKGSFKIVAEAILFFFFFLNFPEKMWLDISCGSSACQLHTLHMKSQARLLVKERICS